MSLSAKVLLFISEYLIIQSQRLQVFTFCYISKGRTGKGKNYVIIRLAISVIVYISRYGRNNRFYPWLNHNQKFLREKYPKIIRQYEQTSSEGFALAVFEELLLCISLCIISIFTNWYGLWIGGFIGCTLHFLIHIGQSIVIRKYIPCLITSIIALPISVYVIYKSICLLESSALLQFYRNFCHCIQSCFCTYADEKLFKIFKEVQQ